MHKSVTIVQWPVGPLFYLTVKVRIHGGKSNLLEKKVTIRSIVNCYEHARD